VSGGAPADKDLGCRLRSAGKVKARPEGRAFARITVAVQTDRRRRHTKPNPASAVPNSARALGSGAEGGAVVVVAGGLSVSKIAPLFAVATQSGTAAVPSFRTRRCRIPVGELRR